MGQNVSTEDQHVLLVLTHRIGQQLKAKVIVFEPDKVCDNGSTMIITLTLAESNRLITQLREFADELGQEKDGTNARE